MKNKSLLQGLVLFLCASSFTSFAGFTISGLTHKNYSWAVLGAGPAGITAVAVLLDQNIDPSDIIWIDPEFTVGRIGKFYRNVPGNLQTKRLTSYVNNCPYFKDFTSPSRDALYQFDPEEFQPLYTIVDPLLDMTAHLSRKVCILKNTISSLTRNNEHWILQGDDCTINAHKVILAIGSKPKRLQYDLPEIPLDVALDKEKLAACISPDDAIAVFGGMHSALLVLKFITELSVKKIVNFYTSPYIYGKPGYPGLEGITAFWAKNVLEDQPPSNLIRALDTADNVKTLLPQCNKVIYAIGYEPNPISINGSLNLAFDEETGIIDDHVYGIGIAFPPTTYYRGKKFAANGVNTYLHYAKKRVALWIAQ